MTRRAWFAAAVAAAALGATLATGAAPAGAEPTSIHASAHAQVQAQAPARPAPPSRYGQVDFQRDLDAIRDSGAPGVLAEVDSGTGRLSGSSGVADLDRGGSVDPGSYFRMGSNTKTFVSVVVLQLVAEHRLSLEDTVDTWLPGLVTGNGNDGRAITVRQLLQHTSGLHNYTDDLVARITSVETYRELQFGVFTPRQLVDIALAQPPDFAPGQGWNYSNTNYALLGMIIERVSGHDWASQVRDRILRPLGLRHTFAPGLRTTLPSPHTSAYLYLGPDTPVETSTENMTWAGAAGALVTTAADLSRFWAALGHGRLLPPAQQRQMRQTVLATAFQDDEPGLRYGLGLGFRPLSCGGGYWTHDGDVPGYSTVTGVSADGRTTAVISMSVAAETPQHQAAWTMVDHVMCGRAG
jgi:D-alanyl-D-alanine carboxypeptidase